VTAVLYLLAFLSGAAALIYQVTWTNLLALSFGSTTLAMSAVVAGFMGGMGLGAWRYHVVGDRCTSPLRVYGMIEIGIALSAAVLSYSFAHLPPIFAAIARELPGDVSLTALRFAIAFALLLIPSALMGATFPALCNTLIRTPSNVDQHLGPIYGWNTVGAACGAIVAGLFLIERFGLSLTSRWGNAINLGVGITALLLARTRSAQAAPQVSPESPTADLVVSTELPFRITGVVLLVSGFTTIAYEVLWFRALRYLVGNSTYALSTVLVVFLLGLGIGGLLLRRVVARGMPERDLAIIQLAIALLALFAIGSASYVVGDPELKQRFSVFSVDVRNLPWQSRLAIHAGLAFVMMLPATLFMGLSFPLASRLFLGDVRRLGARIGESYLLANLGSISGSIVAAVWILPNWGTMGGTRILAMLNLALGLMLFASIRVRVPGRLIWSGAAITAIMGANLLLPSGFGSFWSGNANDMKIAFEEEGDLATVRVWEMIQDPTARGMMIDGNAIGHSRSVLSPIYLKQLLLAHLPMALDNRIRTTLNVGLGSGSTLHTLGSYPELETMDVVEISDAVVRGSRFFDESEILEDPRVEVIVDDAVHYLLRETDRYDLIVSDGKQNEDFSGNGKILSREFYEYALERLEPDGIFIQWIPVGEVPSDFRVIIRTFSEVFPEAETFLSLPFSFFMVGSREPLTGRPVRRDSTQRMDEDLAYLHIDGLDGLRAQWIASKSQLLAEVGPGPINSWDHNILEFTPYRDGRPMDRGDARVENLKLLQRANAQRGSAARYSFMSKSSHMELEEKMREAMVAAFDGQAAWHQSLLDQAGHIDPHGPEAVKSRSDWILRGMKQ
jgi:spermidine synthase